MLVDLSPPRGVHHLAVVVRDLARAERFYCKILGLRVIRRWRDERHRPRSVWLALDARRFLALERAGRAAPRRDDRAPGWHCVALAIRPKEREAWRRRLERARVDIERESPCTLYVRDPDGNLVGLSHYPKVVALTRG